jgi:hypothetical protein
VWRARVLESYGASPYALALAGKPVPAAALEADERLLRQTWTRAAVRDSASLAAERRLP